MAEPLSITTAAITLLKTTWTVGTELKKFHNGVSVISKTLKDLENDIDGLARVLVSMRETFEAITAETGTGHLAAHWTNVAKAIDDGNGIVRELGDELREINKTTNLLDASRKQLRLNLAKDTLAGLRMRVQSLRETLQLSLQAITVTNQVSHQESLNDISVEIRRLAKHFNETIGAQHALEQSQQDEAHVAVMVNLRECVRSAASIVSSASTATKSQAGGNHGSTVIMSDFGDCFPMEHNLAIRRWIEAPSIQEYEQDRSQPPPQSVVDLLSVDESADSSASDIDLEDEITTALLEDGQEKIVAGDLKDAERVLKICSSRLSNVTWEQRGVHAAKQMLKHVEVLQNLFVIYHQQEKWAEGQEILTQKLNVKERICRKNDVTYLEDVVALAKTLQRRGEIIQALLHARRALKGFKKLQSTNNIRSCLRLLIELCNAEDNQDDEEVYTIMLSRMKVDVPFSSEKFVPETIKSGLPSSNATIIAHDQIQEGTGGTTRWEEADDVQEPENSRVSETQQQPPIGVVQRARETDGDLVPFEVRPDHKTHHREARFYETIDQGEEMPAEKQNFLEISSTFPLTPTEMPVEDLLDKSSAVREQTPASAQTTHNTTQHKAESYSITYHTDSDKEYRAHMNTIAMSNDVGPTSSDGLSNLQDQPVDPVEYKISRVHSMHGEETTVDSTEEFSSAHDWALSAIASITERTQEEQQQEHQELGVNLNQDCPYECHAEKNRTWLNQWENPVAAQSIAEQDIMTAQDSENSGPVPMSFSSIDYSPADDDVFSMPSNAAEVQHRASDEDSGNIYDTVTQYTTSLAPNNEVFDWKAACTSKYSLSASSSTDSGFDDNATATTSNIASPVSTNVTIPGSNESKSAGSSSRLARGYMNHSTASGSLPTTRPEQSWPTPKLTWTQGEADNELSLTSHEVDSLSYDDLQESPTKPRPGVSRSSTGSNGRQTWSQHRIARKAVPAALAASSNLKDGISMAIPRLDANNLASASSEPIASTAPRTLNSSVMSLAGTGAATFVEELKETKQQRPATGETRLAHIALIGDGVCGKTSLMQNLAKNPFSSWWDIGHHHITIPAEIDDENIEVTIYDAPGQDGHAMIYHFASNADCILLCFALDFPTSLENVMDKWIHCVPNRGVKVPVLLVGCKSDLRDSPETMTNYPGMGQRLLSTSECNIVRNKIGAFGYLECSAKTGEGVEKVLQAAARAALQLKPGGRKRKKNRFKVFGSTR